MAILTLERHTAVTDVPREVWDPTEGRMPPERAFSDIWYLEVHWAGTGGALLDHLDTAEELLAFERFHEVSMGWRDLFYNWGLDSEGYVYGGRDILIPSQASLRGAATLLVDHGTDEEIGYETDAYFNIARGIFKCWWAVDPSLNPASLRWHSERAATACPGHEVRAIVRRLLDGWIPPGAIMTNSLVPEDLSTHPDAIRAVANGLISQQSGVVKEGARVASRSVVAVVVQRAYEKLLDELVGVSRRVSDLVASVSAANVKAASASARVDKLTARVAALEQAGPSQVPIDIDALTDAVSERIAQRIMNG